ncbi:hypothetical protein ACU686_14285 [Yinghuangia aomiensis]
MVEFGDGFLGGEHGDRGDRGETVAVGAVDLGVVAVECAREGAAQLVVGKLGHREAVGGVEDREVDADLVEALVHQVRQHAGGAVEGVGGRDSPHGGGVDAQVAALGAVGDGTAPVGGVAHLLEHGGEVGAGVLGDEVAHQGQVFDQVAVAVDDGVVEPAADRGDLVGGQVDHARSSGRRAPRTSAPGRAPVCRPFSNVTSPATTVAT